MVAAALGLLLLAPALKERWIYLQTNFFVPERVDRAIKLVERGKNVGYNGIVFVDTKLQSQAPYPDFYRRNVQRFLDAARQHNMKVIPGVFPVGYASGMLARNPSLVESLPSRNVPFQAKGGKLIPVPTEGPIYKNGDLEVATGDRLANMVFQDGPGRTTFLDHEVKHSGATSLRMQDPGNLKEVQGNCRILQKIQVQPWRQYRLRFWVKTEQFDRAGSARALIADPRVHPINFQDLGVRPSQEWTQYNAVFNSLKNSEILLYLGVWGGNRGRLWLDDISVKPVDLLNVTRREGCPLVVTSETGFRYEEGRDFEPVQDPKFGNHPWPGEFDFSHEPPVIQLTSNTRIMEGKTVNLSYYSAATVGMGQSVLCPSEKATGRLLDEEAQRVEELFHPQGFFMGHDEIRIYNWCEAYQKRGLTPAKILQANVQACVQSLKTASSKATCYVWSDMFDPFHNAVGDYYLVNGSFKGAGDGLPKSVVVVNWNSGRPAESLGFFASRGYRQILAGYYDGPVNAIQDWLQKAKGFQGIEGVMYTTWEDRYDDLEAFAKAAWGGK